jgi:hypothetical protein
LLAVIGGEPVPEGLRADNDILLAERQAFAIEVAEAFVDAQQEAFDAEDAAGVDPSLDAIDLHRRKQERFETVCEAYDRGHAEGLRQRDNWRDNALLTVDFLLDEDDAEFSPRTVSDVSTTALAAGLAAAESCSPHLTSHPGLVPGAALVGDGAAPAEGSTGPGTSPG